MTNEPELHAFHAALLPRLRELRAAMPAELAERTVVLRDCFAGDSNLCGVALEISDRRGKPTVETEIAGLYLHYHLDGDETELDAAVMDVTRHFHAPMPVHQLDLRTGLTVAVAIDHASAELEAWFAQVVNYAAGSAAVMAELAHLPSNYRPELFPDTNKLGWLGRPTALLGDRTPAAALCAGEVDAVVAAARAEAAAAGLST